MVPFVRDNQHKDLIEPFKAGCDGKLEKFFALHFQRRSSLDRTSLIEDSLVPWLVELSSNAYKAHYKFLLFPLMKVR
jgi:hypothetical protein